MPNPVSSSSIVNFSLLDYTGENCTILSNWAPDRGLAVGDCCQILGLGNV